LPLRATLAGFFGRQRWPRQAEVVAVRAWRAAATSGRSPAKARLSVSLVLIAALYVGLPGGGPAGATPPGSGDLIVFVRHMRTDEIFTIDVSVPSIVKRLTTNTATDTEPALSPDGNRIAFASDRGGDFDVYVMDVGGGDVKRLTLNDGDDHDPAWSPDGKRIAFASNRDGNYDIYRVTATPQAQEVGLHNMTNATVGDNREPDWSPDGSAIAFSGDKSGDKELYTVSMQSRAVTQITNYPDADDSQPTWSPDGELMAFTSDRARNPDIWRVALQSSASALQLTTSAAAQRDPVWSPDGTQIAFATDEFRQVGLATMRARDGSNVTQIAGAGGLLPSWGGFTLTPPPPPTPVEATVELEPHGHFIIANFDLNQKVTKTMIQLLRGGKVISFGVGTKPVSAHGKHWSIQVDYLKPDTNYKLRLWATIPNLENKWAVVHKDEVKTLQRLVTVNFQRVLVSDDSDDLSCGEIIWDAKVSGASLANGKQTPYPFRVPMVENVDDWKDICTGEGWNTSESLTVRPVSKDQMTIKVIGVDDDLSPFDIPLKCDHKYGGCRAIGDWSEGKVTVDVGSNNFTAAAETFSHKAYIESNTHDDDGPGWKWRVRYFVKYV
jgi:TolB protein